VKPSTKGAFFQWSLLPQTLTLTHIQFSLDCSCSRLGLVPQNRTFGGNWSRFLQGRSNSVKALKRSWSIDLSRGKSLTHWHYPVLVHQLIVEDPLCCVFSAIIQEYMEWFLQCFDTCY